MVSVSKLVKMSAPFRVLYVEDESAIQIRMLKYLKKMFDYVDGADDGEAGLKLYKTNKYDIVITDLSMPKMNGIDMLKEIKKLNEDQSVLITTAYAQSAYMLEAINIGVDGYIIKPFVFKQLNFELYKIVSRLQKFQESALYKKHLENLIDKKSAVVLSLLAFQNENYEKTLYSMVNMIEDRDSYTAGHSTRVAQYSQMIAQKMDYSKEDCQKIYQAGMLHDIGKIATPDAVLLNPKRLNDIEYRLVQEHVSVSYKLLKNIPMFEELSEIVYSHHEHYDGSGYPRGLIGDEILPLAQIIIVADAFDAMTTNRIYKGRKSVTLALKEIEKLQKKQFHPNVVDAALDVLQSVQIDINIDQIPKTEIEKERFAYFYKDILCDVYNKNYLELLLSKNRFEQQYTCMELIFINKFSIFNKEQTWANGDEFLKKFAKVVQNYFEEDLVFRVFGDDFVVLCERKKSMKNFSGVLHELLEDTNLSYKHTRIDLTLNEILTIEDIEKYDGVKLERNR